MQNTFLSALELYQTHQVQVTLNSVLITVAFNTALIQLIYNSFSTMSDKKHNREDNQPSEELATNSGKWMGLMELWQRIYVPDINTAWS